MQDIYDSEFLFLKSFKVCHEAHLESLGVDKIETLTKTKLQQPRGCMHTLDLPYAGLRHLWFRLNEWSTWEKVAFQIPLVLEIARIPFFFYFMRNLDIFLSIKDLPISRVLLHSFGLCYKQTMPSYPT